MALANAELQQTPTPNQVICKHPMPAGAAALQFFTAHGICLRVNESSLLLLIPAHNEEHRIEQVLRSYAAYFSQHYKGTFKILVILNGCTDNTLSVVERVAAECRCVSYLNFPEPIGKGGALIEGLKLAESADLIGYVDADGATPPHAFLELVRNSHKADCVIGSRWLPGAIIRQAQSRKRRVASRVFHTLVQLLFWMNIRDTQCGAKVLRREAVQRIHPTLQIADMAFDINLLYSLKRAGFKVLELPTEWNDIAGSKVVLALTSLTMLLSVIRLRLIYSPFYAWLGPLRPIERWLYRKLRAPQPLPQHNSALSDRTRNDRPHSRTCS